MNTARLLHGIHLGLLWALASAASPAAAETLRIVGSDLLGPEFAARLTRSAEEHEIALQLDLVGTRPGLARLQTGQADLGLFALPPGEVPPGDPHISRVVAAQPIAVVVPEAMPLTQITHAQLRGLFALGAAESISTWGDLGLTGEWRGRAITVMTPSPDVTLTLPLAQRLLFPTFAPKPTVIQVPALDALPARLLATGGGLALTPVVPAPGSGLRALAVAASLTEPASQPTPENLQHGYTLRLSLYVTFRRDAAPRLMPLLRQLLGEEGTETLARAHFQALPAAARNRLLLELEGLH